jgi:hypothetical protein
LLNLSDDVGQIQAHGLLSNNCSDYIAGASGSQRPD